MGRVPPRSAATARASHAALACCVAMLGAAVVSLPAYGASVDAAPSEHAAAAAPHPAGEVASPEPAASPGRGGDPLGSLGMVDRKQPISVDADSLELDYAHDRILYRGHVQARQGELGIASATLTITYKRADGGGRTDLREIVAEGDVLITQGARKATGAKAVFDQTTRTVVLSGNPVVEDGPNRVSGERITVFLDEGRSVVDSGAGKRVSATLFPSSVPEGERGAGRSGVSR